jgi:hypothetical protein
VHFFQVSIVSRSGPDDCVSWNSEPVSVDVVDRTSSDMDYEGFRPRTQFLARRKTPRVSLIFLLLDGQVMEPKRLAGRMSPQRDEGMDVIVACAGQPGNLDVLRRTARHARFYLAPADTSEEDLRELAIKQTGGDIVTLLRGASHGGLVGLDD